MSNNGSKCCFGIHEENIVFLLRLQKRLVINEMALNLLDVNNDCLTEIFKYLTVPELADVAATCTRFQTIARDVFTIFSLCHQPDCFKIDMNSMERRPQAAAILRHFGDFLTKLKVVFLDSGERFCNADVLNTMVMCCADKLERLELINLEVLQPDEINNARTLFGQVKELILHKSSSAHRWLLSNAEQLTRLTLNGFSPAKAGQFLSNDYPLLQSLTLNNNQNRRLFSPAIDIIDFLKRHPKLNELELRGGGWYDLSLIAECCPSLKKLSIWKWEDYDILPIAELPNLTSLKLSIGRFADGPLIDILNRTNSSQSLEELLISGCIINGDKLVAPFALGHFTNLKRISIKNVEETNNQFVSWIRRLTGGGGPRTYTIRDDILIGLVQHLPHLERVLLDLSPWTMRLLLEPSTHLRISEIIGSRNQSMKVMVGQNPNKLL